MCPRGAAPGSLCCPSPGGRVGTPSTPWPAPSALGDYPPACPGYSDIVSPKSPACSQGQPMGCVPLTPVPIHPFTHCLGDISSSIPIKRDWGVPSLAHVCCTLVEDGSNGEQGEGSAGAWNEGHEQGCVGARGGAGGLGRVGGDRGMVKRQAGAHSSPFCPPHVFFISPLHAHLHPWCGLAGCHTGVPAALTAQCCRGCALPASLCLHWVPCLAVTLPCAAACTGLS
ncbi:hypothetical protein Nmel_010358 [Mimus melanotis]